MRHSDYTLQEYMKGHPLPQSDKCVEKEYFYGVYITSNGCYAAFVCKKRKKVPSTSILTCRKITSGPDAVSRSEFLLRELEERYLISDRIEDSCLEFNNGDIVIHADGNGEHTAIILSKGETHSEILFITSNPKWHPETRKLTYEEQTLLGFSIKKTSYFAKVIRCNNEMAATGRSYPQHRIFDLIKEFCF